MQMATEEQNLTIDHDGSTAVVTLTHRSDGIDHRPKSEPSRFGGVGDDHRSPSMMMAVAEDELTESSDSEIDEHEKCDCLIDGGSPGKELRLPFTSVYEDEDELNARGYFRVPPTLVTISAVRDEGHHLLNRYTYNIHLSHRGTEWAVRRQYSDFRELNSSLLMFRARSNITDPLYRLQRSRKRVPVHTLSHEDTQNTNASAARNGTDEGAIRLMKPDEAAADDMGPTRQRPCKLPHFPLMPDTTVSDDRLDQRITQFSNYLAAVLHVPAYRNHRKTLEFIGVSRLSFIEQVSDKDLEMYVKKSPDAAAPLGHIKRFFTTKVAPWRKRWLIVKDSYVVYIRPRHQEISEVLLFENNFSVVPVQSAPRNINITNLHRTLTIKCEDAFQASEWMAAIDKAATRPAGQIWLKTHRFHSTYPPRTDSRAQWFVDGANFMSAAADMMEAAQEEIFITDWWLSPEIFMKRPPPSQQYDFRHRLDLILQRKAQQGVKIFVLLYKEVTYALTINSLYTKGKLRALHPNIKVLRHRGDLFWAHHEKLIIVDQIVAFVGGIDLCYGRWDNCHHKLSDTGALVVEQNITLQEDSTLAGKLLSGLIDYEKERMENKAPINEEKLRQHMLGRHADSPMTEKPKASLKALAMMAEWKLKRDRTKHDNENEDAISIGQRSTISITGEEFWWVGKDYVNFIFKDFFGLELPFDDFIDRTETPRMPWHDIASVVCGSAARDVARHFIERWNSCKIEKCHDDRKLPFIVPKSYENVEIPHRLHKHLRHTVACNVQVIRSVGRYSSGRRITESSIHEAYLNAISNSKHYIYIENQFFVSQAAGQKTVINQITEAIVERIIRAHKNNEDFRVYVMIPLLPGFEVGIALFTVLHWTHLSICKGPTSLLHVLEQEVGDPSRYICFCSLRKHDKIGENPITELIYIHSKLMIVDDRVCIIGSANINDRSQLGDRDSEVAVYIEDTQFDIHDNQRFECGKVCGRLRKQLFREHLGLLDNKSDRIDISDPSSEEFFMLWQSVAASNTEIYEEVFKCLPSDTVRSKSQLNNYSNVFAQSMGAESAAKRMDDVIGYLVQFPLEFLIDSDLTPPLSSKEGWAPSTVFV